VARRVLEKSPHSFIVGAGAQQFAASQGFTVEQQLKQTEPPQVQIHVVYFTPKCSKHTNNTTECTNNTTD